MEEVQIGHGRDGMNLDDSSHMLHRN